MFYFSSLTSLLFTLSIFDLSSGYISFSGLFYLIVVLNLRAITLPAEDTPLSVLPALENSTFLFDLMRHVFCKASNIFPSIVFYVCSCMATPE